MVVDSQSKAMALRSLDENRPIDCTQWYASITEPLVARWPDAAVVVLQGRQKGWAIGQDVRQGRGSSSQLHEVIAQYMVWTKTAGSRSVDGEVKVVCTKCRYGHRVEGSKAARWLHGPSGFFLREPEPSATPLDPHELERAWLDYLGEKPKDPDLPDLPPKEWDAIEQVMSRLATKDRAAVIEALRVLVKDGRVKCEKLAQPGKPGARPARVWSRK